MISKLIEVCLYLSGYLVLASLFGMWLGHRLKGERRGRSVIPDCPERGQIVDRWA